MRITVVDNDMSLLRSLRIILKRQGHDVTCFADPKSALDAMDAAETDVVLVDLIMPGMTGLEFLCAAAPRFSARCRKAIITGHAEKLTEPELATAGVDALFPKPLDLAQLARFVEEPADADAQESGTWQARRSSKGLQKAQNGRNPLQ